ncbi:MAG: ribonuclease PH [Magnetococcales bacterium]|nr:ribonuclease PH [Magnetococcales bacterium]
MRVSGRLPEQMRDVVMQRGFMPHAEGSCLIAFGETRVICTASVEEGQPRWLRGEDRGWISAEYGMLPRATHERTSREAAQGKQGGRTLEIQRLIGRSLRSVVDMQALGKRTVWIDCDVIQADGGTRTAAITGGFVALAEACGRLVEKGLLTASPIRDCVAAISCGLLEGVPLLDLEYAEDSICETDMNFVMTGAGRFVEIQGTAERHPFSRAEFEALAVLGEQGIAQLIAQQRTILGELAP